MRNYAVCVLFFMTLLTQQAAADTWFKTVPDNAICVEPGDTGNGGLSAALRSAKAGDTIVLKAGVYRESNLLIRDPATSTPAEPITVMGEPGGAVTITGMTTIGGWQRGATGTYETTLNFEPTHLYARGAPLIKSRHPNSGWWTATTAEGQHLTDTQRLKGLTDLSAGSAYVWTQHGNTFFEMKIKSFDRGAGRLVFEFDEQQQRWAKLQPGDRYYLLNHSSLVDQPGEWAVTPDGERWRVVLKPHDKSDLDAIEAVNTSRPILSVRDAKHVRIANLRLSGSPQMALEFTGCENIEVAWCIMDSARIGCQVRQTHNAVVRNCLMIANDTGLSMHSTQQATVTFCEIAHNSVDGLIVSYESNGITLDRNYIHDHMLWGHPDNIQMYKDVSDVVVSNNLLVNAGQSMMIEGAAGMTFRNNMLVGSIANMVIFGHGNARDALLENNTFAFTGYSCIVMSADGYTVRSNIFAPANGGPAYGVRGVKNYNGDFNLFWTGAGRPVKSLLSTDDGWHDTIEAFVEVTGQDRHSVVADPLFVSAPVCFTVIDTDKLAAASESVLPLRGGTADFAVGQTVEINFDGVARRIIAADDESISIGPPLREKPTKSWLVANWSDRTDLALDLRIRPDSAARGMRPDRGDVGADLDIAGYRRGDFDGDSTRDVPEYPAGLRPDPRF